MKAVAVAAVTVVLLAGCGSSHSTTRFLPALKYSSVKRTLPDS